MNAKPKYVGIDLGTSTSALAWLRPDGSPEIVPNADAERLTPSVVYFHNEKDVSGETVLVGSAARDGGDPSRTVFQVKRHMDNPNWTVELDGRVWTPAMISSIILSKLKQDCSQIIGPIEDVVITVPANFNELARKSTVQAAELAGLKVKRLVNEPTAAALYYVHSFGIKGRILVYDLGGGTLDITILETDGKDFRILLSEGARHLGGSNFDEILLDLYADEISRSLGRQFFSNERERRRALLTVENTKKTLSKLQRYVDTIGSEREGIARVELTRDVFESSIQKLLTRTVMLVEQALDSLELSTSDINHVVLVGGSTRIPRVRQLLTKKFKKEPLACGNVDECVALGAALFSQQAGSVQEVCNASYGTIALVENAATGESKVQNSIVIPKNTPIPCSGSQTYYTSEDNEKLIEVEVTQGEDHDPKYVDIIGKITLEVPPNRPAGCEVKVTYSYDENQRVKVLVTDVLTGVSKQISVTYEGKGVLSEEELVRRSAYLKQIVIQ